MSADALATEFLKQHTAASIYRDAGCPEHDGSEVMMHQEESIRASGRS